MSLRKNYELRENNKAFIIGKIVSKLKPSYTVFGEEFYLMDVSVKRLNETEDIIPVTVSERLIDTSKDHTGTYVQVEGQFRSYNKHEGDKARLLLSLFANELGFIETNADDISENEISLEGYICKPPVYRKTPLGREIADLLIAVNRPYGKSDYIPCICWGRNAGYVKDLPVGTGLSVKGRIQSRTYIKKFGDAGSEERTAYEVSVSKMEVLG